jgi:hypothetical protein
MDQTVQLLQQIQLAGFLNPVVSGDVQGQQDQSQPQSTATRNDESQRSVVFSTRDVHGTSPFGVQPSGGYGDMRTPRAGLSTSFSPFSPDPNLFSGGDLTTGPPPKRPEVILHYPGSAVDYAQGFGTAPALPHDLSNTMGADGKVTVPNFAVLFEKPIPVALSRPPSGSLNTSQERQEYFEIPEHEPDAITDLNGTLASLDLDNVHHHQSPSSSPASAPTSVTWKAPSSSSSSM